MIYQAKPNLTTDSRESTGRNTFVVFAIGFVAVVAISNSVVLVDNEFILHVVVVEFSSFVIS